MHIPTVNIGDRQKGRMRAESVIDCPPEREAITAAMKTAMSSDFKAIAANTDSPLATDTPRRRSYRSCCVFSAAPPITQKTFYDLPVMK